MIWPGVVRLVLLGIYMDLFLTALRESSFFLQMISITKISWRKCLCWEFYILLSIKGFFPIMYGVCNKRFLLFFNFQHEGSQQWGWSPLHSVKHQRWQYKNGVHFKTKLFNKRCWLTFNVLALSSANKWSKFSFVIIADLTWIFGLWDFQTASTQEEHQCKLCLFPSELNSWDSRDNEVDPSYGTYAYSI